MANADIDVTLDLTKLQAGVGEAVLDTGVPMPTGQVRRGGVVSAGSRFTTRGRRRQ